MPTHRRVSALSSAFTCFVLMLALCAPAAIAAKPAPATETPGNTCTPDLPEPGSIEKIRQYTTDPKYLPASVAELRARIASAGSKAADLVLDVKDPSGAANKVPGSVVLAPETWPPRESSLPYNLGLIDLQDLLRSPLSPVDKNAAALNLAVVHMRLGNWEDALTVLAAITLPEGPGVSAGTVTYFAGLCHEALGHAPEAQAAFTKAAASAEARVSQDGPLVALLAQRKLQGRR